MRATVDNILLLASLAQTGVERLVARWRNAPAAAAGCSNQDEDPVRYKKRIL